MERMVEDAERAIRNPRKAVCLPSTVCLPPTVCLPSIPPSVDISLPDRVLLEKVRHLPLLVLEGLCVLNDPKLADLCQLKFFLKLDKKQMEARRQLRGTGREESWMYKSAVCRGGGG